MAAFDAARFTNALDDMADIVRGLGSHDEGSAEQADAILRDLVPAVDDLAEQARARLRAQNV